MELLTKIQFRHLSLLPIVPETLQIKLLNVRKFYYLGKTPQANAKG